MSRLLLSFVVLYAATLGVARADVCLDDRTANTASRYVPACAPLVKRQAVVEGRFGKDRFDGQTPGQVVALSGGSAMAMGYSRLYAIDADAVRVLATSPDDSVEAIDRAAPMAGGLVGFRESTVVGLRMNGTTAFSFSIGAGTGDPTMVVQDAYGTFWLASGGLYEVSNEAGSLRPVIAPSPDVTALFLDARKRAYASLADGTLWALYPYPSARAAIVRGPIKLPAKAGPSAGTDSFWPPYVSAIAPDGSMWSSDITSIVHVRTDGSVHVIRLARPFMDVYSINMPPISFEMAPDGSLWPQWGPLVHITTGDIVEVIDGLPRQNDNPLSVSDDGSVWYAASDPEEIVHFRLP